MKKGPGPWNLICGRTWCTEFFSLLCSSSPSLITRLLPLGFLPWLVWLVPPSSLSVSGFCLGSAEGNHHQEQPVSGEVRWSFYIPNFSPAKLWAIWTPQWESAAPIRTLCPSYSSLYKCSLSFTHLFLGMVKLAPSVLHWLLLMLFTLSALLFIAPLKFSSITLSAKASWYPASLPFLVQNSSLTPHCAEWKHGDEKRVTFIEMGFAPSFKNYIFLEIFR